MLHKVKPAALASRRASVFVNWQVGDPQDNPSQVSLQAIRADLAVLNHPSRFATPQSTIDAVMYSLRGGTAVLARDDVRHRLAVIDESRLREMIALLQKRDGRIAPRWSDDDIEKLLETWTACRG